MWSRIWFGKLDQMIGSIVVGEDMSVKEDSSDQLRKVEAKVEVVVMMMSD